MPIEYATPAHAADFPSLARLLEDVELSNEWALAKIDNDIDWEIATAGAAVLPGDYLDSMYALQEKKIMRERIERGDTGAVRYLAELEWFIRARKAMALDALLEFSEGPSRIRQYLARRALRTMDLAT